MRRRAALPSLLLPLLGCGADLPADGAGAAAPDGAVVAQAMRAARPGPLLDLPAHLDGLLSASTLSPGEAAACPQVEVLTTGSEGEGLRELWTGGCRLGDLWIDGVLERMDHDGEQWLAGEGFSVRRGEALELWLDGAIEVVEQGDLLLLDASATWCGGPDAPCEEGPVTIDLSYSLFPADGYPDAYDVTVSGVIADPAPVMIEGSWSIDLLACGTEPTDGVFALRRGQRHDLTLDGALRCDACASWSVQGRAAPPFCSVDLTLPVTAPWGSAALGIESRYALSILRSDPVRWPRARGGLRPSSGGPQFAQTADSTDLGGASLVHTLPGEGGGSDGDDTASGADDTGGQEGVDPVGTGYQVGDTAYDLTATNQLGQLWSLYDQQGQIVALLVGNADVGSSMLEPLSFLGGLPGVQSVALIGRDELSNPADFADASRYAFDYGLDQVLLDPSAALTPQWGGDSAPRLFLIGPDLQILYSAYGGGISEATVAAQVEAIRERYRL